MLNVDVSTSWQPPSALAHAYRDVPALVLGASGFIGAWTTRALHACGARVTVATRDAGRTTAALGRLAPSVTITIADLSTPAEVSALLTRTTPAVVFNLTGYGVDATERDAATMTAINAELVETVCTALAERAHRGWAGLDLVHAGSALEYGAIQGTLHEGLEAMPNTDYGHTKLRGTRAVQACAAASGIRGVVARAFTVYGPGEHDHRLLPSLLRTAQTGERLALTAGRQPRDFTYVEDVAEGLLRLGIATAPADTVVNLATGHLTTVRTFAETAARELGIDPALLDFGALPERDKEMWHGPVDVTRLRQVTGWVPPTSVADGIRRTREHLDG